MSTPRPAPGRIVSIRVGRVRAQPWADATGRHATQTTAYLKEPVTGDVALGPLGLEGDEQADLRVHGGPDRATLAYCDEHYPLWRSELGIAEMGPGGFAENLTVTGHHERNVCLGDVYEAGSARVQVSQPRGPCANISRRWGRPELLERVVETRRFGWYLRVLEPGTLRAGDAFTLLERPFDEWPIERAFLVRRERAKRREEAALLATIPALSEGWRAQLAAETKV